MALDENTAGVTAKAAKSKEERKQSVLDRTEIVLAILLGVAAILTAWSTFQSAQLGSAMTAAYSEGIRVSDAASQAFNDASANDIADQALFLEFAKASQAGEEETALYIEESLMSEELAAAVDWWFEQPESAGYATPFTEENPNWSTALYDDAEAWSDPLVLGHPPAPARQSRWRHFQPALLSAMARQITTRDRL